MNHDPVMGLMVVICVVLLVASQLTRPRLMDIGRAIRLQDRLLWGPLPTPEELGQLAGRAVELVIETRDAARTRTHPPGSFVAAVDELRTRLVELETLLDHWQLRLLRCEDRPHLESPPAKALPAVRWRLPVLRLVACRELVARALPVDRCHTPMYVHLGALRRGLRTAGRAFAGARRKPPERLSQRLDDILADLQVLLRDSVETHRVLWGPFVEWRQTLPRPDGA